VTNPKDGPASAVIGKKVDRSWSEGLRTTTRPKAQYTALKQIEKDNFQVISKFLTCIVICRRVPWVRAGYTCGGRRVGRARVRRVDGYGGHGRRVFFSKSYPIRLIPVPIAGTQVPRVRVRGYSGTQVGESGTGRIGGSNVITVY
jgi:hypothetical protein